MSKRTLPISAELVVSELQREVVIEKQSIDDDDLSPSQGYFFLRNSNSKPSSYGLCGEGALISKPRDAALTINLYHQLDLAPSWDSSRTLLGIDWGDCGQGQH